jgi:hypothetical protein
MVIVVNEVYLTFTFGAAEPCFARTLVTCACALTDANRSRSDAATEAKDEVAEVIRLV